MVKRIQRRRSFCRSKIFPPHRCSRSAKSFPQNRSCCPPAPSAGRSGPARTSGSCARTEEIFSQYLYSNGLPDPELLIRPGGEKRISNYLLWQCAYSEFYFCDTLWPDFDEREFDKALIAYQHRERRFGGVKP